MLPNVLLGLFSLLVFCSAYLSQITFLTQNFSFREDGNISGGFEVFVAGIGVAGFLFALFNSFLKKKNGSPYIVLGALVVVFGFFYNNETLPRPLQNSFLGGELFFAFVVSFALAVTGLVVEWLVQDPH